jgi:hypothetical protein
MLQKLLKAEKKKKIFIVVVITAFLFRIIPGIVLGNPTGVDVYAHSQFIDSIVDNRNIPYGAMFGYPMGYHSFYASIELITGLDSLYLQLIFSSLIGVLTGIVVFIMLKKINTSVAFLGMTLFLFSPGNILYSASRGMPQIIGLFFIILIINIIFTKIDKKRLFLLFIFSLGIAVMHAGSTMLIYTIAIVLLFTFLLKLFKIPKNRRIAFDITIGALVFIFVLLFFIANTPTVHYQLFRIALVALPVLFLWLVLSKENKKIAANLFAVFLIFFSIFFSFSIYPPMNKYYDEKFYYLKQQTNQGFGKTLDILKPASTTTTIKPEKTTTTAEEIEAEKETGRVEEIEAVKTTTTISPIFESTKKQMTELSSSLTIPYYMFIIGPLLLLLTIPGLFYIIKKHSLLGLFCILWAAVMFIPVFKSGDIRQIAFIAIPLSITGAFSAYAWNYFKKKPIVLVFLVLLIIPALFATAYMTVNWAGKYDNEASEWIKENTTENSKFVCLYSCIFIQTKSNRTTLSSFDFFTETNLTKKREFLQENNITHIYTSKNEELKFIRSEMNPIERFLDILGIHTPERFTRVQCVKGFCELENFTLVYHNKKINIYKSDS